jgi:hypothetical protein
MPRRRAEDELQDPDANSKRLQRFLHVRVIAD